MVRSREGVFPFPSLMSGGSARLQQKFHSQAAPPDSSLRAPKGTHFSGVEFEPYYNGAK